MTRAAGVIALIAVKRVVAGLSVVVATTVPTVVKSGTFSQSLNKRLEETLVVKKKFDSLARDKPWTFQKCSLHGMILAKECISKVRDEANE